MFLIRIIVCISVLLIAGCYKSASSESERIAAADDRDDASDAFEHPREVYMNEDDPHYDIYEGAGIENRCQNDTDCIVTGCVESTCAAEPIEINDDAFCNQLLMTSGREPLFGSCGCLDGLCTWYFESDFDRECTDNEDCNGLGVPPEGITQKGIWYCNSDMECSFGFPANWN
ncbi:MAG: hypothetical protein JXR76_06885 [Deltaproteobacteria bacterium]|nr:hypothetical protein [Deltaproteobacteria bacterium]